MKKEEIPQLYREMGYNFEELAKTNHMLMGYIMELEQRLRLIDELWNGKVCLCSVMVGDQEKEGNTVPYLYCIIKEGKKRIGCPYVEASEEDIKKALKAHKLITKT